MVDPSSRTGGLIRLDAGQLGIPRLTMPATQIQPATVLLPPIVATLESGSEEVMTRVTPEPVEDRIHTMTTWPSRDGQRRRHDGASIVIMLRLRGRP
jgi:hypothetical protein